MASRAASTAPSKLKASRCLAHVELVWVVAVDHLRRGPAVIGDPLDVLSSENPLDAFVVIEFPPTIPGTS